ncbi:MAG: MFS transporter [Rhodobacteraceae bacterium]|nr:MFS transporter [Paracoccaceae bacterium]
MAVLAAARISRPQIVSLSGVGVWLGAFAAMVPAFKAQIGADDATMGLILMCGALGGILGMYFTPRLAPVLGRWHHPAGGMILAAACGLVFMAATPVQFAAAFLTVALAVAYWDMGTNMRIAALETRHGLHLQNLNHAMFAFVFGASALAVTLARRAGWEPAEIHPWIVLTLALFALGSLEGPSWRPAPRRGDHPNARIPWALVLPGAGILFAAFVTENATESWSALHMERTLGAARGSGGVGPAMFGVTMGVGRIFGQYLTGRLGDLRLITWGAALGSLGLVVLALAPAVPVAVAGVALFGLGVAVMVPTGNAVLGRVSPPGLQSDIIARAWMIGFTGFFIGPTLIGAISQATSLRVSFLFAAAVMALAIPLVGLLRRRGA